MTWGTSALRQPARPIQRPSSAGLRDSSRGRERCVPEVSATYRGHGVHHEPGPHRTNDLTRTSPRTAQAFERSAASKPSAARPGPLWSGRRDSNPRPSPWQHGERRSSRVVESRSPRSERCPGPARTSRYRPVGPRSWTRVGQTLHSRALVHRAPTAYRGSLRADRGTCIVQPGCAAVPVADAVGSLQQRADGGVTERAGGAVPGRSAGLDHGRYCGTPRRFWRRCGRGLRLSPGKSKPSGSSSPGSVESTIQQ